MRRRNANAAQRKLERTAARAHPGLPSPTTQDIILKKARQLYAQYQEDTKWGKIGVSLKSERLLGRAEGLAIALAAIRRTSARDELARVRAVDSQDEPAGDEG